MYDVEVEFVCFGDEVVVVWVYFWVVVGYVDFFDVWIGGELVKYFVYCFV